MRAGTASQKHEVAQSSPVTMMPSPCARTLLDVGVYAANAHTGVIKQSRACQVSLRLNEPKKRLTYPVSTCRSPNPQLRRSISHPRIPVSRRARCRATAKHKMSKIALTRRGTQRLQRCRAMDLMQAGWRLSPSRTSSSSVMCLLCQT